MVRRFHDIGIDHETREVISETEYTVLTTAKAEKANIASIVVEVGVIRFLYDGSHPYPEGELVTTGKRFVLGGQKNLLQFKCVKVGLTNAILRVHYEAASA